jgi:hypothetical protein
MNSYVYMYSRLCTSQLIFLRLCLSPSRKFAEELVAEALQLLAVLAQDRVLFLEFAAVRATVREVRHRLLRLRDAD